MNRKKFSLFLCIMALFLLVGCKQEGDKENKPYASITWESKREKEFGIYDYPSLSKDEAYDLLENKFELGIPQIIKKAEAMFKKDIVTEEVIAETPEYSIFVTESEVIVRGYYPFTKGEEIDVFAYIDLTYNYDNEAKRAFLNKQSFSMSNYGGNAVYPKDNFNEILQSVSQFIELPEEEFERSLKNFEKNYGEVDQRPVAEKIIFYSNDEEREEKKSVSQSMRIGFNDAREMREIYATLVDYSE